jgi:transcription initiation factor TFIID subunit 11
VLFNGQDKTRFATGFGMDLICLAIFLSPQLKEALSSPKLLWLGKNSFAVYLIHGTMLRTVYAWAIYGITIPPMKEVEKNGHIELVKGDNLKPTHGLFYSGVALAVWFVMVYALAEFVWTRHVDPTAARITAWLEKRTSREGGGAEKTNGHAGLLTPLGNGRPA